MTILRPRVGLEVLGCVADGLRTSTRIALELGMDRRRAYEALQRLEARGLIEPTGRAGRQGLRWRLTSRGAGLRKRVARG